MNNIFLTGEVFLYKTPWTWTLKQGILCYFACELQISETAHKFKSWRSCTALWTFLLTALCRVGSLVLSRQMSNKALLAVLNRDKYVLIRLANAAGLQSCLKIVPKVRRRFMWILRAEMLSLFPGGAGGSAGSAAGGAGPAGHHAGAGEEGQGVSHEDRSERGGAHQRGRAAGCWPAQVGCDAQTS